MHRSVQQVRGFLDRIESLRHGRACPGHPRLSRCGTDVDARHKAGHDGACGSSRAGTALAALCRATRQATARQRVAAAVLFRITRSAASLISRFTASSPSISFNSSIAVCSPISRRAWRTVVIGGLQASANATRCLSPRHGPHRCAARTILGNPRRGILPDPAHSWARAKPPGSGLAIGETARRTARRQASRLIGQ